jgi:predicted RNase H-like HicB family nuclease
MSKKETINLDIELLPEGYFLATSKDVPGLVAEAKTLEEVTEIAEDLVKILFRKI